MISVAAAHFGAVRRRVYPHKKLQDPKVRLPLDFMADRCQRLIRDILAGK